MRPETNIRRIKHSRRRRGSRGREIFMGFLLLLFILALAVMLTAGGVFGYRYWDGSRTSGQPLETSREVVPETMGERD
ncbi:hypothetical protein AALB39_06725 [Lachnospiraceae bacterium 54-53]